MMNDEEAALLRAVCWNPADDAPRLIYADWLDEHDGPLLAAFIREQIKSSAEKRSYRTSTCVDKKSGSLVNYGLFNEHRGFPCEFLGHQHSFIEYAQAGWFAVDPIVSVTLTDLTFEQIGRREWEHGCFLYRSSLIRRFPFSSFKDELFDLLCHEIIPGYSEFALFKNPDEGKAAVSKACVAYGRQIAGLPPLQ